MWRNPNHTQPETSSPPEPSGRLIAASERPGRGRGPDTELRTTLDAYQGHPYLSLRVWSRGADGQWFPTRKGVSVRLGEVEDVAAALVEGARLAHAPAVRPARTSTPTASPRRLPTRSERPQPAPARRSEPAYDRSEFDPEFDEF